MRKKNKIYSLWSLDLYLETSQTCTCNEEIYLVQKVCYESYFNAHWQIQILPYVLISRRNSPTLTSLDKIIHVSKYCNAVHAILIFRKYRENIVLGIIFRFSIWIFWKLGVHQKLNSSLTTNANFRYSFRYGVYTVHAMSCSLYACARGIESCVNYTFDSTTCRKCSFESLEHAMHCYHGLGSEFLNF